MIAAFFDLISLRGALGLEAAVTLSFCLPFTSGIEPLYAGAGTPSKPDDVSGRGIAWANRTDVDDR